MRPPARKSCFHQRWSLLVLAALVGLGAGCDSDDKLENKNPGLNDLNVVAAFGDSITQGNRCACVPYPARLPPLIGKAVVPAGIRGTRALESVGRTQQVIDRSRPAYMLILYGVNDIIHGKSVPSIIDALSQMALICRQNNVVPVLATYPIPFGSHGVFAGGTANLNENIRILAQSLGLECVDLEREFALASEGAAAGRVVTDPNLMHPDGLHPNDAGTQIMALAFADLF
jgi:lysophospholipase L1-like esterase